VSSRFARANIWPLVLCAFIPLSVVFTFLFGPGVLVFATAGVGIVPLAWFMGVATVELGKHAGPGIGGLLNATFGNATELIIAFFALISGLHEIVKASLTGSIIGNVLLVMGLGMVAGGLRYKKQVFSREAFGTQTTMLVLAVIGMAMPALYVISASASGGISRLTLEEMSIGIAGILLVGYVLGLIFSLWTHRDVFSPIAERGPKPVWSVRFSIVVLLVSTLLVALESEILVGSIEAARATLGLTELFVGVIIVAIIGNAAEHGTAIIMAYRNNIELSVAVVMSSTTQIALFVAPILVFSSVLTAAVLTLDFEIFELAAVAFSVVVLASAASDGQSNWYEGTLLVLVYAILAVAFFFHP